MTTPPPTTPRRAWFGLAVLMLPVFLISVDNTVLTFALPQIAEEFRPSASTQLWMVDIYSLVLAALLVSMGSLGDRIGRRRILLIGSVGFGLVSIGAAFSPSAEALVGARALLGVFGAMLMPSTLSLLRNMFLNDTDRRLAIAIWGSGFAVGSSVGPILGGALLEHFAWGSVFLIAVPLLLPLLIFARWLLPESKDPNPGPVDPISILLTFTMMLPIVWGVKTAAHEGLDVVTVLAFLVGIASGWLFVRRQNRSKTPMLDMGLFRYAPFTSSVISNFLSIAGLIGFMFFVTQHLQLVLGLSPLNAGLVMLPGAACSVFAGLFVVKLAQRFAPHQLMMVGLILISAGFFMVVAFRHDLSVVAIITSFVVLELGVGMSQTIASDTIVSAVPPAKAGAASAVSETAYELGAVVGTATLGTIFTASYRTNIVLPEGLSATQAKDAGESIAGATSVAAELPGGIAQQLLDSAFLAFDSGILPTALIAGIGTLVAAIIVARANRGHSTGRVVR